MKKICVYIVLTILILTIFSGALVSCKNSIEDSTNMVLSETNIESQSDRRLINLSNEQILDLVSQISYHARRAGVVKILGEGEEQPGSGFTFEHWNYENGSFVSITYSGFYDDLAQVQRVYVQDKDGNTLYDTWSDSHYELVHVSIRGEDLDYHEVILTEEESQKVRAILDTYEWVDDRGKAESKYLFLNSSNSIYKYDPVIGMLDSYIVPTRHTFLSDEDRLYINFLIEKYEKQINQ